MTTQQEKSSHKFWMINYLELIAALIWMITGLYAIYYSPGGLIFYLYTMPSGIWAGGIPLLIGCILIFVNLLKLEKLTLYVNDNNEIGIESTRIFKKTVNFSKKDIILTQLGTSERNSRRWIVLGIIFLLVFDVHFLIGNDLYPYSPVGEFLFRCGIFTLIGCVVYFFAWHYQLRIIYLNHKGDNPEPFEVVMNLPNKKFSFYYDLFGVISKNMEDSIRCGEFLTQKPSEFLNFLGLIFLIIGMLGSLSFEFFLGEFTGILCWIFGLRIISYIVNYKKNLFNDSDLLAGKLVKNIELNSIESIPFKYSSLFELFGSIYLIIQAVKYIFQWYWFPGAGFNSLIFVPALLLYGVVMIRIFQPKIIKQLIMSNRKMRLNRQYGALNNIQKLIADKKGFISNAIIMLLATILPFVLYGIGLYYFIL